MASGIDSKRQNVAVPVAQPSHESIVKRLKQIYFFQPAWFSE